MQRVLMAGTSTKGGILTVETLILQNPPSGYHVEHVVTHSAGGIGKVFPGLRATLKILVSKRYHLAHVHFASGFSVRRKGLLTIALRMRGIPVILHAHGHAFDKFYRDLPRRRQASIRRFLQRSDMLIVLSDSWRSFYAEAGKLPAERIRILLNPVSLPVSTVNQITKDPVRLLFMGRMGERKGAYDLVRAARIVASAGKRFLLTMIGDGEVDAIQKLSNELDLGDYLQVKSWIPESEKSAMLLQSHVFVLPSTAEGLPMALLEGMAAGLACVTTPVGGIPELIHDGENGLLVPVADPPALAQALERLIDDASLRAALGRHARFSVEPLSVTEYSRKLGQVYDAVLHPDSRLAAPRSS